MGQEPVPSVRRHTAVFVSCVVGFVVLLILLRSFGAMLVDSRRARLLEAWEGSLGPFEAILASYPDRETNASARRAEELSAALGIDIAPRSAQDGTRPDPDALGRYQRSMVAVRHYAMREIERDRPGREPPPEAARRFLVEQRGSLDALCSQLVTAEPPRWARRLSTLTRPPLPNLKGQIELHRLLVANALHRAHAEDLDGAARSLEASWRLGAELRDQPLLVPQLMALEVARLQFGALRRIEPLPSVWEQRLAQLDFRTSIFTALQLEGWEWMQLVDPGSVLPDEDAARSPVRRVLRPYLSLCATQHGEAWHQRLLQLSELDSLCDGSWRDRGITLAVQQPAWNLPARQVGFGNLDELLPRLARWELDREMTAKLLALRRARAESGGRWPASLPGIQASASCPADRWVYERLPDGGAALAFSRRIDWGDLRGAELPLRYVADR
jgi:hypothetical protein